MGETDCFFSDKSAGHRGLVGSAVVRKFQSLGFTNLVVRTYAELDLTRQSDVESFLATEKPLYVVLAAAKVGGIHANNTYPADFIAINLQIQTILPTATALRKSSSWDPPVFIPNLRPNPSRKMRSYRPPWSPLTNGMPLQRSQGSKCAKLTESNTASMQFPPCQRICTVPTIIFTPKIPTFCLL